MAKKFTVEVRYRIVLKLVQFTESKSTKCLLKRKLIVITNINSCSLNEDNNRTFSVLIGL